MKAARSREQIVHGSLFDSSLRWERRMDRASRMVALSCRPTGLAFFPGMKIPPSRCWSQFDRRGLCMQAKFPCPRALLPRNQDILGPSLDKQGVPGESNLCQLQTKRNQDGDHQEQMMPLKTDITTVSSLVYFKMIGRVVSSLVAPAEAIQVK